MRGRSSEYYVEGDVHLRQRHAAWAIGRLSDAVGARPTVDLLHLATITICLILDDRSTVLSISGRAIATIDLTAATVASSTPGSISAFSASPSRARCRRRTRSTMLRAPITACNSAKRDSRSTVATSTTGTSQLVWVTS